LASSSFVSHAGFGSGSVPTDPSALAALAPASRSAAARPATVNSFLMDSPYTSRMLALAALVVALAVPLPDLNQTEPRALSIVWRDHRLLLVFTRRVDNAEAVDVANDHTGRIAGLDLADQTA
jgi:hypothetical protein